MTAKTTSHFITNTNIHPSSQVLSQLFTNTFFFHPYAVYQKKWLLKPHHIWLLTQTSTLHHNCYLNYLLTHLFISICRLLNEMAAKTTSHLIINTNIHPSSQLPCHLFTNTFFSSICRLPNEMTTKTTSHLITNTNIHPSSQLLSHLLTNTFLFHPYAVY